MYPMSHYLLGVKYVMIRLVGVEEYIYIRRVCQAYVKMMYSRITISGIVLQYKITLKKAMLPVFHQIL